MNDKKIRVQSLDPEHPSFTAGTIYTIFGKDAADAVNEALGEAPTTPGKLYARAWRCSDRKLYHFVAGWPEPVAQLMLLRSGGQLAEDGRGTGGNCGRAMRSNRQKFFW